MDEMILQVLMDTYAAAAHTTAVVAKEENFMIVVELKWFWKLEGWDRKGATV